jgi:hypothetical protein
LNAAVWFRLVRLLIVSPDPRHPRRIQAETPLTLLSRFSRPPLPARLRAQIGSGNRGSRSLPLFFWIALNNETRKQISLRI